MTRLMHCIPVIFLSISLTSYAHDYWFAPEQFYVEKANKFRVQLLLGGDFKSEGHRALRADITRKFELHTHEQSPIDLMNASLTPSKDAYTDISVEKPGAYWLITERDPTYIEFEAKKFEDYLKHENLQNIIEDRKKRKESKEPGREKYSRSVKTYVSVGSAKDDKTWKMRVPQTIEINPQVNPSKIQKGQNVSFEVLFESKPLKEVFVNAMHASENGEVKILTSQTDKKGLVSFQLNEPGTWLVRLVHMRRCLDCRKANWESFWGALSFGVKP